MSAVVRFGVIGAGAFASRRHIPDILRHGDAKLVALCRRDPEVLKRLADHFEPERTYTDWRKMLDECPLDAVVIATPNNLHYEQAEAALERGLHVLLEKPMTVRADEAGKLRDLAKRLGLKLLVALNPPYWAHCHAIRRAIHGGRIGEVESVSFYWAGNSEVVFADAPMPAVMPGPVNPTLFRADPAQCGGGHLMDGGAHLVSEILWVTDMCASRVACVMDQSPSDRRAALVMTLENGAIATICSVGNSHAARRRVRNAIGGSRGIITIDGFEFRTTIGTDGGESEEFTEADLPAVAGPVVNLVDAVLHQGELFSNGDHGANVQQVLAAAYESVSTSRLISVRSS